MELDGFNTIRIYLFARSAEENCTTENVSSLRSVKGATLPCAASNELLVSAQAALEQGDYAALRSHLEALGAYADALKDDGAALYETLRSYID